MPDAEALAEHIPQCGNLLDRDWQGQERPGMALSDSAGSKGVLDLVRRIQQAECICHADARSAHSFGNCCLG